MIERCFARLEQFHATDLGLATAYVNPSIREFNRDHFKKLFGEGIFCGAIAIGHPVLGSPDQQHHQEKMAARRGEAR